MSTPKNEDGKQMIKCSFCSEDQSAAEIGAHLMQCGNKTEQCPNCEKYIRRAIFAYHYENNCSNLDEFEDEMNRPAAANNNTSVTPKTPPPKSPSPERQNRHTSTVHINLSSPPIQQPTITATTRSTSVKTTYGCPYCYYDCNIKDIEIHQNNCLQNPKNKKNEQVPSIDALAQQNPNHSTFNETVICGICEKAIRLHDFDAHEVACTERELRESKAEGRLTVTVRQQNDLHQCINCGRVVNAPDISFHQRICQQNPNYSNDPTYTSSYRLLPSYSRNADVLY